MCGGWWQNILYNGGDLFQVNIVLEVWTFAMVGVGFEEVWHDFSTRQCVVGMSSMRHVRKYFDDGSPVGGWHAYSGGRHCPWWHTIGWPHTSLPSSLLPSHPTYQPTLLQIVQQLLSGARPSSSQPSPSLSPAWLPFWVAALSTADVATWKLLLYVFPHMCVCAHAMAVSEKQFWREYTLAFSRNPTVLIWNVCVFPLLVSTDMHVLRCNVNKIAKMIEEKSLHLLQLLVRPCHAHKIQRFITSYLFWHW